MDQKPTVTNDDIVVVRRYMMSQHCGFNKARPRMVIAEALKMEDRHFRAVCAEIPEIITSHQFGYYILPLVDLSGEETRKAREILEGEDKRRIISLYLRMRRQRQAVRRMAGKERQPAFAFAV